MLFGREVTATAVEKRTGRMLSSGYLKNGSPMDSCGSLIHPLVVNIHIFFAVSCVGGCWRGLLTRGLMDIDGHPHFRRCVGGAEVGLIYVLSCS